MKRPGAIACVLVALASPGFAQDALERAGGALEAGDRALARAALLDLLAAEPAVRDPALPRSLDVFRARGATDTWLEAVERWRGSNAADAAVHFYAGVTWQDLKHLARAEAALGRARDLAPGDPGVQQALAWNSVLRFDAEGALARTARATFPGAERIRSEQQARLAAEPWPAVLAVTALGLGLVAAATWALGRAARP